MEPILRSHFNNFKKTFEIDTQESPAKESKAFEKFVNYVLFSLDYPEIFTGDTDLLDFVCVGGSNDTGIDGIGIRVNDRLVRSIDEVKEILQASKKIRVEFVFIQTKMRSYLDTAELNTFGTGVKVFFSEVYLPENLKIKEMREIKDFIYSDEKVISKLEENPSLYLYYIGTGGEPNDVNFAGAQKWLIKELTENFYFEDVEVKIFGGKQLIKYCRELENKFEVQMNIIDIFPLIVDPKADVKKAYAFTCSAQEILKILTKEDGSIRRSLFNDNVRDYLGNKGTINSEIEKTIVNDPEMFLLCNNGITIVCADFEQVRDKLVKIENPQIVNGCQTSNSIYNFRKNPNTSKLQLLVRLISTENSNVTNKILRGTNRQNQVLDEAFEATQPFHQETLEPFFLAYDHSVKLYYERRAKQYNNDPLIKKTHIVNLRIITQTFVGMFLNAPHDSFRHEAKLLGEYAGDKENRKIFRDDHSPYPYYISALTWYMFEKFFREERIDFSYKPYKSHLYLIFKFSVGEFQPKFIKSKALDAYCDKLLKLLDDEQFEKQLKSVLLVFDSSQKKWSQNKSRFGIKDNKEFTELLLKQSREYYMDAQTPITDDVAKLVHQGKILRINWNGGSWFGFIKREGPYDNLFFNNRSYRGEPRNLLQDSKVTFEIGHNEKGEHATNVVIVK